MSGLYAVLTSQLPMQAAACTTVYLDTASYPSSSTNFARVSLSPDNVFGDNTAVQIAQQTPTLTDTADAGYAAGAVVGIALKCGLSRHSAVRVAFRGSSASGRSRRAIRYARSSSVARRRDSVA